MNRKELEVMAEAYVSQDIFKKEPYYWEHESFIQYAMREAYRTGFLAGRAAAADIAKRYISGSPWIAKRIEELGEDT